MANIIKIKRKTTTGAPALGQLEIGELCFVTPDNVLFIKKDAGTIIGPFSPGTSAAWGAITGTLSTQTDLQAALDAKAPLANPTFTGTPAAPTVTAGDSTTKLATTAFVSGAVSTAISNLIGGAPGALDTLNELAAALADDAAFSSTITALIGTKLDANSTIDGGTIA
jgi:hypothetical protein